MASGNSSKSHSRKLVKDSLNVPLPKLDQSLVIVKDLKEQPDSPWILLTGAGKPTYYAVDDWIANESGFISFYNKEELVYTCRLEGIWAVVSRDVVKVTNDRDMTTFQLEDAKITEAFYEKLDPKGWEDSKRVAMAHLGLEALKEDTRPPVGQYL